MGNARKQLEQWLDSLTDEETVRLFVRLRSFTMQGPLTHQQFMELHKPAIDLSSPTRPKTKVQLDRLAAHALAVEQLVQARERFHAALNDLRRAERQHGPEQAHGYPSRTKDQEAEVARLAERVGELHDELEGAILVEVAARPHQPQKKRGPRVAFPLAGILKKTVDYSSEYTNAEVRRA